MDSPFSSLRRGSPSWDLKEPLTWTSLTLLRGRMKSHVVLLGRVLADAGIRCRTSTTLDLNTVKSRVKDEGLSFLTISLPNFGADFERGLDQGYVDSSLFHGFHRVHNGSLPAFLLGLTSLVFDKRCGALLDSPDVEAIQCIRQVCYLFKKLELPCSDARYASAYKGYVETDQSVQSATDSLSVSRKGDFQRISALVFGHLFSKVDREIFLGDIVPKHGPGATADYLKANAKYDNRTWTHRLEELFPAGEFLFSSHRHYFNNIEDGGEIDWLEPGAEIPVRVISVPKTMKTPRIIAIEPTHMQYVQQGLMEKIVGGIESDDLLTSFIGFKDQTVNRDLACQASRDGDLATLDLSEASDRVSNLHVLLLFGYWRHLCDAVQACRSTKADVPGHGIITLAKFASMGSALTFPVEAMVFTTIILLGIEKELGVPLTEEIIHDLVGQVRVYGDDIIVPVRFVHSVIRELEAFGLRVNGRKSFWTGKFRESCGGDFYDGFDVNVVKARRNLPTNREHVEEIDSAVSLRNQMYFSGFWKTAEHLDNLIGELIPYPTVHVHSPGLGRHTVMDYEVQRMCPHLQRPLVRAMVDASKAPDSDISGEGALLKFFLRRGDEPFADKNHLERAGRPWRVDIKPKWIPPY